MKIFDVKKLISKLTGVDLVKESMADVPGAINMKNRGTQWHEIGDASSLLDIPEIVAQNIEDMQSSFKNSFGVKVIFSYIGEDPAVNKSQVDMIKNDLNIPPEKKEDFLKTIKFINQFGIRLLMSPKAMESYKGKGDTTKVNGSDWFFQNFGYAWGASKVPTGKIRSAYPITEIDLKYPPREGKKHVQVVTESRNGGWGIFFKDIENNLTPVTSDEYYNRSGLSRDDQGFVDKEHYIGTRGQHNKYFRNPELQKILLPTQTVYMLPNGVKDPTPIPIPKSSKQNSSEQSINRSGINPNEKFYIWPRNDGTMWWIPFDNKKDKSKVFPLTKEQVDHINYEKGNWFEIGNEDVEKYSWETIPADKREQVEQDFFYKTQIMNEIWDYLESKNSIHVGLQSYKWCVIGPKFTNSKNIGQGETVGKLKTHYTHIRDMNDSSSFIGKRAKWVVQSNEFNANRAAIVGTKLNAAQSMSGLSDIAEYDTLKDAISYAFKSWGINCPPPDEKTIQEAEMAFSAMHNPTQQNIEQQNTQVPVSTQNLQLTPQNTRNLNNTIQNTQQQPINNTQDNNINEGVIAASTEREINNKNSNIIRKLKKLC